MPKLASHNSLTYLPPKKWYLYPFRFIARCQSKSLEEQYKLGIRFFDFRISFDRNFNVEIRHGSMAYKGDVETFLDFLNKKRNCYVRLVLERKLDEEDIQLFQHYCDTLVKKYPRVKFCGGIDKESWKVIYEFKYNPTYEDKYSSNNTLGTPCTGTYLDDWWPWIYAKCNNKRNIKEGTDKEFLMIDFVNIQ